PLPALQQVFSAQKYDTDTVDALLAEFALIALVDTLPPDLIPYAHQRPWLLPRLLVFAGVSNTGKSVLLNALLDLLVTPPLEAHIAPNDQFNNGYFGYRASGINFGDIGDTVTSVKLRESFAVLLPFL